MDKKRLRRWLLLFFLALLLPAALLIQQSYSRLKWEVFHQHQKMAAELSRRIDNRLTRLITIEDNRTFADYSYLSGADGAQQKVSVRSPLSNYPIESEIPGVVGYFQVDAQGVLTTPLMPTVDDIYPADSKELVQRNAVRNQLRQILAANQLVRDAPAEAVEVSGAVVEEKLAPAPTVGAEVAMADIAVSSLGAESDTTTVFKSKDRSLGSSSKAQAVRKPIAFEQLKERGKQIASKNSYAQVEDIALKQNFQQKGESRRQSLAVKKKRDAVSERLERPAAKIAREQSMPKPIQQNIRIRTFESDVDPFEFSLLDSGHFVLFRKVWRNGQRYTQGLLINQKQFLSLVQDEFLSSDLSQMSGVLVAYQGNILISFSESNLQTSPIKSQALTGEQLYQVRLSDPLSDLQMIYSITDLPVGAGGRVILWLALVMASVLLGGFYIMYRLGLRQINLAAQQQDFVSAVSHELKTPLTSIRMYGEILKQGWAPEENKRRYYDFIYDESERLSRLINNVLQLARMNRNEQAPELSMCNVQVLVQEIRTKIASQLEAAHFKLTVEEHESNKETNVSVDRDWLIQVMINLVDNAVKFSAKATRREVVIRISPLDKKQVQFTVRDFGPGIDKQQMKAIFELFYRGENELTRDTVGTGIGLSLVHQMVTSMGGKVTVKNGEPSATSNAEFPGAAFTLSFPIVSLPDTP